MYTQFIGYVIVNHLTCFHHVNMEKYIISFIFIYNRLFIIFGDYKHTFKVSSAILSYYMYYSFHQCTENTYFMPNIIIWVKFSNLPLFTYL